MARDKAIELLKQRIQPKASPVLFDSMIEKITKSAGDSDSMKATFKEVLILIKMFVNVKLAEDISDDLYNLLS